MAHGPVDATAGWRICATLALFALLAACQRPQPESAAQAAAVPAVDVPVGPVPGPAEDPLATRNPFGKDPVALAEGRRLFVLYNCAGCHGDYGGGGMGPSLRDETWLYGSDDARVASSIMQGRAHGMPSWGSLITTEQVWKITGYIKSMRTTLEPNPPR